MRTLLKRSLARAETPQGAASEPEVRASLAVYGPPAAPRRSHLRRAAVGLGRLVLTLLALSLGLAGGAVLWFDRSVEAVQAHSPALRRAAKQLTLPLPGRAAIAILLGIDTRQGPESGSANTDTLMLVRADPASRTISLLSLPRDLNVPIYCGGIVVTHDRINSAFSHCGPTGVLETVGHLTGLGINYLATVDFHGFQQIVDRLGGIWLDVDRSYYNKNVGTAATDYSNIDLQPGYQRLDGSEALAFVRYRHTDSDLYRLAREQEFVRAVKEQVAAGFDPFELPSLVSALTGNLQIASKAGLSDSTVLRYAFLAATLPAGHVIQVTIPAAELAPLDVGGADELSASATAIDTAVARFEHPVVVGAHRPPRPPRAVVARPPRLAPPPQARATTLTVLNGNGVPGSAANASSLLSARGYHVLPPPGGAAANAPSTGYAETQIYLAPGAPRAAAAARALAALLGGARIGARPPGPALAALDPGAMLLVVLGRSFEGQLVTATSPPAAPSTHTTARPAPPPQVQPDGGAGRSLLAPLAHQVSFPLEFPTLVAAGSQPDAYGGDTVVRLYPITAARRAVRLVYVSGGDQYWGIEETNWTGAPVLADASLQRVLAGRTYDLYYSGGALHMVVLKADGASYWVVNTLLDTLSNPTMIAIAEGLRPLGGARAVTAASGG